MKYASLVAIVLVYLAIVQVDRALLAAQAAMPMLAGEPIPLARFARNEVYHVTAKQAYAFWSSGGSAVTLLDIRDASDVEAQGFASLTDLSVTYRTRPADGYRFDDDGNRYPGKPSPEFLRGLEAGLASLGRTRDDWIVLLSHDGADGADAARKLYARGYARVVTVIDGFSGSPDLPADLAGWKRAGLPVESEASARLVRR